MARSEISFDESYHLEEKKYDTNSDLDQNPE